MLPQERIEALLNAFEAYERVVSPSYDEVVLEVAARAKASGSLGKIDIGALTTWRRLRADTPWMSGLMALPDLEMCAHTSRAVGAARDTEMEPAAAAAAARCELSPFLSSTVATPSPRPCASLRRPTGWRCMTGERTVGSPDSA